MSVSQTTMDNQLKNIHPGEVLSEEFMAPMGLTAYRLAKDTGMNQTRVSQIIKGKRSVTADTALRLSRYFGTTAKFWMNLQTAYDLEETERLKEKELDSIQAAQAM